VAPAAACCRERRAAARTAHLHLMTSRIISSDAKAAPSRQVRLCAAPSDGQVMNNRIYRCWAVATSVPPTLGPRRCTASVLTGGILK